MMHGLIIFGDLQYRAMILMAPDGMFFLMTTEAPVAGVNEWVIGCTRHGEIKPPSVPGGLVTITCTQEVDLLEHVKGGDKPVFWQAFDTFHKAFKVYVDELIREDRALASVMGRKGGVA